MLATGNPGKVREFRRLLAGLPLEVVTPAEAGITIDVVEDGATYEANASKKAREYAAAGRCMALADDSGIEVDALDGRPGVLSARYGGSGLDDAGRNALMLGELAGVPAEQRTARYRAVVAVCQPGGTVRTFEGTHEGSIGLLERGDGGFGYDPLFVTGDGRTTAEMSAEEKDAISHRGQAMRLAVTFLRGMTA